MLSNKYKVVKENKGNNLFKYISTPDYTVGGTVRVFHNCFLLLNETSFFTFSIKFLLLSEL